MRPAHTLLGLVERLRDRYAERMGSNPTHLLVPRELKPRLVKEMQELCSVRVPAPHGEESLFGMCVLDYDGEHFEVTGDPYRLLKLRIAGGAT